MDDDSNPIGPNVISEALKSDEELPAGKSEGL
jgi:hypothetical protein